MASFSVRCLFLWRRREDQVKRFLYEERITLWSAADLDEAISLAEAEATRYAAGGDVYLGIAQAYEMYEAVQVSGIEVFSLLRESDLAKDEYISAFFVTGSERTQ